jgi:integrase/recombinase XerD
MSALAPVLESFFTDRLAQQRRASPHTIAAYRDAFRLLLRFAHKRLGKAPSDLDLQDLDAPLIGAFLEHLEKDRHNSVRTRNARLAAIHSLFRYAALREPDHAALIQRVLVTYLEPPEVKALLAAPDCHTLIGRRDRALLLLAV